MRDFVNQNGIGIAVPLDAKSLAGTLSGLRRDAAERERRGKRRRELAESAYSWDRAAAEVEESIRRSLR